MMAMGIPVNVKQPAALVKKGEGQAVGLKRSTGELKEGMQRLCAFLNGLGGMVLFGIRPEGAIEGQAVSDQTLRDVAQARAPLVAGGVAGASRKESAGQVGTKLGLSRDHVEILRLCREERSLIELMSAIGRQNRTKFRDSLIRPLIEAGLLAYTIPDKPRSRMQRYRTTQAGLAVTSDKATDQGPGRGGDRHA
jgi:hypothetical protein